MLQSSWPSGKGASMPVEVVAAEGVLAGGVEVEVWVGVAVVVGAAEVVT